MASLEDRVTILETKLEQANIALFKAETELARRLTALNGEYARIDIVVATRLETEVYKKSEDQRLMWERAAEKSMARLSDLDAHGVRLNSIETQVNKITWIETAVNALPSMKSYQDKVAGAVALAVFLSVAVPAVLHFFIK